MSITILLVSSEFPVLLICLQATILPDSLCRIFTTWPQVPLPRSPSAIKLSIGVAYFLPSMVSMPLCFMISSICRSYWSWLGCCWANVPMKFGRPLCSGACQRKFKEKEQKRELTPRLRLSGVGLLAVGEPMANELPTPARPSEGRGLGPRPERLELGLGLKPAGPPPPRWRPWPAAPPPPPPLPSSEGKLSWRTRARRSSALVVIVENVHLRSPS